jgi:hypothetical protein
MGPRLTTQGARRKGPEIRQLVSHNCFGANFSAVLLEPCALSVEPSVVILLPDEVK